MKTEKTMDMNKDSRLSRTYEADGYHFVTFKIADSPTAKVSVHLLNMSKNQALDAWLSLQISGIGSRQHQANASPL